MKSILSDYNCNGSVISARVDAEDWVWLAGFVAGRWGVEVSPEEVHEWFGRNCLVGKNMVMRDMARCRLWSDSSWVLWLKNRVAERLPAGCPEVSFEPAFGGLLAHFGKWFSTPLHVGFLSVEETPEHLENLARLEPFEVPNGFATPGLPRHRNEYLKPIDRTAARVAPTEEH